MLLNAEAQTVKFGNEIGGGLCVEGCALRGVEGGLCDERWVLRG
jgi:hypothetical protein